MKSTIVTLSLVALSAIAATPALALPGESSTRNTHTSEYRVGTGTRKSWGTSSLSIVGSEYSEALKMESNAPGFAYASVSFNGRGLVGSAYGQNAPRNPDPVAQGAYTREYSQYRLHSTEGFVEEERYVYGSSTYTHSVGAY